MQAQGEDAALRIQVPEQPGVEPMAYAGGMIVY